MKTVEEIVAIYGARAQATDLLKSKMRTLRDYYNGDVIVPLPEINADEQSAVANLLAHGLDRQQCGLLQLDLTFTVHHLILHANAHETTHK